MARLDRDDSMGKPEDSPGAWLHQADVSMPHVVNLMKPLTEHQLHREPYGEAAHC